jgi:hypothetical protein
MRQYYPSDVKMPKVGDVVVLKNREGEQSQGIVFDFAEVRKEK